jgi:KaiC/GvpD/RAD55 family RecA-like ATPase
MSFSSSILFERSFYKDFFDKHVGKYKKNSGLVVLGTPGIGNSAFGSYCVYRGLQDGKTVVYQGGGRD